MDAQSERWQQEDEEREFARRVELVQIAIQAADGDGWFSARDIEDLKYFLRVKEFFQ